MVLRIKLRYPDAETFIEKFSVNVGRAGLFLTTRGLQPVATELRFELRLADDQVVLAGVGRVAAVYEPDPERPEAPYGMAIEFMRVTREGRDLVMRMLEHRRSHGLGEPALPVPEAPDAATMEAEARRSSASIRVPQRPAALEPERPRMPRTRAIELVATLAAQPMEEAEREVARSEAVALDGLLARTPTQERHRGAADSVDLARVLERAREIAGDPSTTEGLDRFSAELAELSQPLSALPPHSPQPMAEGTARGVRVREPLAPLPEARASAERASAAPTPHARAQADEAEAREAADAAEDLPAVAAADGSGDAAADVPPPAARPAQPPRERFSAFTRRADDPLAEHTPPPSFAAPAPHRQAPHPGAPSTLAAAAQLRAESEAARAAAEAAPTEGAAPSDDAPVPSEAEPRRKRIGRPERLTRPPGVFARRAGDAPAPPVDALVVDEQPPAEPPAPAGESAGRAMSDATFARVLAELEESDADPVAQPQPLAFAEPAVAIDPLDQLALDDLDDAEPMAASPRRRASQPWSATVDETAPVEQIELDASLDSGIHSLDDSGFEILAEAELGGHEAHEGPTTASPYDAPGAYGYRSAPPSAETYDEPAREPITARSALAAAVSRPTWTRSKALDQAEPAQPVNELAPPTIPGRVATRDIDLESALDALDIEADAPAVPLQPRQPEPTHDDDFPIELEFDDP